MSKRFGRNQKRKMREEIQKLEYSVEALRYGNKELVADHKRLQKMLNSIVDKITRTTQFSAFLEAKNISDDPNRPSYSIPGCPPPAILFCRPEQTIDMEYLETKTYLVHRMFLEIENRRENPFDVYLHLYIGKDEHYGYFISKEALRTFGLPIDVIAKEIANKLNAFVMKNGK